MKNLFIKDAKFGLVLCAEDGSILPGQRDLTIKSPLNGPIIVTVDFLISGDPKTGGVIMNLEETKGDIPCN